LAGQFFPIPVAVGYMLNVGIVLPATMSGITWVAMAAIRVCTGCIIVGFFCWEASAQPVELRIVQGVLATNTNGVYVLQVSQPERGWTQYLQAAVVQAWVDGSATTIVAGVTIPADDVAAGGVAVRVAGVEGAEVVTWWSNATPGWYFGSGLALGTIATATLVWVGLGRSFLRVVGGDGG